MKHTKKSKTAIGLHGKDKNFKYDYKTVYSDYPDVGKVYDAEVGKFAFQHLRFRDRFDPEKVGYAVIQSQNMFFKVFDESELPKKKNWKFIRDF